MSSYTISSYEEIPKKNFLTVSDLVECGLFFSPEQVRRTAQAGLQGIRINSKTIIFRRADLVTWLDSCRSCTPRKRNKPPVDLQEVL